MAVVREDVVKVVYDVDDRPLEQVDNGIDKLVRNTQKMAGASGVGNLTKGFNSAAQSAQKLAKVDFASRITSGIEEFNAEAAVAKDKVTGFANAVKRIAAHPVKTLNDKILATQMSAGKAVAQFKRLAATKITTLKTNVTNITTALTEGQGGAKGFATAVKNIGKVSINSLVNGVRNLTTNIKGKAVTAAQKLKTNIGSLAKTSLKSLVNSVKKLGTGLGSALTSAGKLAGKLAGLTLKGLAVGTAALGTAAAAAGAGIFKLTDMASDLSETQNKISVAFGDGTDKLTGHAAEVDKWANNSVKSMGLAKQTALDMTALFGDMGTSMGLSQGEAADMSMSLTQLGADLASFKNMSIDETTTALNGIFTGETESLKRLGVVMTQTNLEQFALTKGITKGLDKMTEAEKVQLRYAYVMEKTANAQGDFARTGGGFANQLRMLKEQFKEMGTNIGQSFMPAMTKGLQTLNGFATELNDVFKDGIQEGDFAKIGDIIGRALNEGMTALQSGLPKVISFISGLVGTLAQSILPKIPQILTTLVDGVTSIVMNLANIIEQNSGTLVNGVVGLVSSLANSLLTMLPRLLLLGAQLIVQLVAGISQQLPTLIPKAVEAITTLVNGLIGCLDQLIQCGLQIVQGLIQGIVQNLPQIALAALQLLQGLADSLLNNLQLIIETAIQLINSLCSGLLSSLPAILDAAVQLVFGLVEGLISNLDLLLQGAVQLVLALTQGLLNCLPQILQAAMNLVFGLVQGLLQNLNLIVQAAFNLVIALIQGIVQMLPQIITMGIQLILQLVMGIVQNLPLIINAGIQLIVSLIVGLVQAIPQLIAMIPQICVGIIEGLFSINWLQVGWDLIKGILNGVWEGAKALVGGIWDGIKSLFGGKGKEAGAAADEGIASGLATSSYIPTTAANGVATSTTNALSATGNTYGIGTTANANLASGLNGSAYAPATAAANAATMTDNELAKVANGTAQYGSAAASGLASGINSNSGTAVSAAASMSTQVENAASSDVTVKVVGDTSSMSSFTSQIADLVSGAAAKLQGIPEAFTSAFTKAKSATTEALSAITAAFKAEMAKLITSATSSLQRLVEVVRTSMFSIRVAISATNLYSSGVSLMQGLNRGMRSQIPALIATAVRAAAAIKRATDVELKIHSPSRVMEESGENAGLGQIKGLRNTIPDMQIAARDVSNASIPYDTYSPETSSTYNSGGNSEYTTISPVFNLTISGSQDDRAMARRVKRYVAEAISETFESLERKSVKVQEV